MTSKKPVKTAAKPKPAEARPKPAAFAPPDDEPTTVTTGLFLSTLRRADPPRWATVVRHALRTAGTIAGAAVALQVPRKTLQRWLEKNPGLRKGIDLVQHGQHPKPAARP